MIIASIECDIDVTDISTSDLLEALHYKLPRMHKKDRDKFMELSEELTNANLPKQLLTMKDESKYNLFMEHFDRITLEQLESLIK